MSDKPSLATAEVVAALDRWQAETSVRRYPHLVITEVLDRAASDHAYLSVTFAHGSDWFGWDVKPIADLFLRWLMEKHDPWEEDLGDPVTVRIIRDDVDAEHRLHQDDVAHAIARRYGERYPAEAASIAWIADYCK